MKNSKTSRKNVSAKKRNTSTPLRREAVTKPRTPTLKTLNQFLKLHVGEVTDSYLRNLAQSDASLTKAPQESMEAMRERLIDLEKSLTKAMKHEQVLIKEKNDLQSKFLDLEKSVVDLNEKISNQKSVLFNVQEGINRIQNSIWIGKMRMSSKAGEMTIALAQLRLKNMSAYISEEELDEWIEEKINLAESIDRLINSFDESDLESLTGQIQVCLDE